MVGRNQKKKKKKKKKKLSIFQDEGRQLSKYFCQNDDFHTLKTFLYR